MVSWTAFSFLATKQSPKPSQIVMMRKAESVSVSWRHRDGALVPSLCVFCEVSLCTVYPKKYARGFCFAVLCCGYTLTDFPISIRLTSLALWQSNDCPSASKATLMNMDKYIMWIHYERLHNHNKAKHNKTVCIFLGIYCMCTWFVWAKWLQCSSPSFVLPRRKNVHDFGYHYIISDSQCWTLHNYGRKIPDEIPTILGSNTRLGLSIHYNLSYFV